MVTKVWNYWLDVLLGKRKVKWWLLVMVMAVVSIGGTSFKIMTQGSRIIPKLPETIKGVIENHYPSDLVITIKGGEVKTNAVEPVYITFKTEEMADLWVLLQVKQDRMPISRIRLLTIDTKASPEDFERYQTWALLTGKSLIYQSKGEIKIVPVSRFDSMVIDKEWLDSKLAKFTDPKLTTWLRAGVFIAPVGLFVAVTAGQILAYMGQALLVWAMGRVLSIRPGYWRVLGMVVAITFIPDVAEVAATQVWNSRVVIFGAAIWSTVIQGVVLAASYFLFKAYARQEKNSKK